ncbi:MAG: dipeptide epimerase [Candidatus Marinimicrobia bacterium]|nr:dipeptide epimerase [Candidatus Neomarinimicrobiota bacterium]
MSDRLIISHIDIFPFDVSSDHEFRIATMVISGAQNVLIRIRTSGGLDGWGEASSFRAIVGETQKINLAAAQELREIFLGKDALEYAARICEMDAFLPLNSTIKSAFDMALYDIAAKHAALPLYRFLGGEKRPMETDLTMGISTLDKAGQDARDIIKKGFRKIKTKVGIDPEEDILRLREIRKAVGPDIGIRIDANQGWDRITAVKCLQAMEELDIEFCEQPVRRHDLEGMRYVSERCSIPVMADESVFSPEDALAVIRSQAAPLINIKLSKSGGMRNAIMIANICEAAHIPCMTGCMSESGLANTAFCHFAMAHPVVKYFDLDANVGHINEPIIGGVGIRNGMIEFPDGISGIGAEPDPDFVKTLKSL